MKCTYKKFDATIAVPLGNMRNYPGVKFKVVPDSIPEKFRCALSKSLYYYFDKNGKIRFGNHFGTCTSIFNTLTYETKEEHFKLIKVIKIT